MPPAPKSLGQFKPASLLVDRQWIGPDILSLQCLQHPSGPQKAPSENGSSKKAQCYVCFFPSRWGGSHEGLASSGERAPVVLTAPRMERSVLLPFWWLLHALHPPHAASPKTCLDATSFAWCSNFHIQPPMYDVSVSWAHFDHLNSHERWLPRATSISRCGLLWQPESRGIALPCSYNCSAPELYQVRTMLSKASASKTELSSC